MLSTRGYECKGWENLRLVTFNILHQWLWSMGFTLNIAGTLDAELEPRISELMQTCKQRSQTCPVRKGGFSNAFQNVWSSLPSHLR